MCWSCVSESEYCWAVYYNQLYTGIHGLVVWRPSLLPVLVFLTQITLLSRVLFIYHYSKLWVLWQTVVWQTLRNQKSRLKDENVIWPILMSGITILGWSSFASQGSPARRCCNIPRTHDNEMTCWCQQEGISKTCDQEIFCPTRMLFRALCRGEDISGQISSIVPSISNVHTQSSSCTQCDHF